jgi:hypothetical protein
MVMARLNATLGHLNGTSSGGARRLGPVTRVFLGAVFAVLAFSADARAQDAYWATNGCYYTWTGHTYTTQLCARLVALYTYDYWNPVRGEWLVRIEDNPANTYQDWTFLNGPLYAWTARLGVARPGRDAVTAGIWAIRPAGGVWFSTIAQTTDTPAGQLARSVGTAINNAFNNSMIANTLR